MPANKRLSETEAGINNKSQGSVATRVRCGGNFTTKFNAESDWWIFFL